MEYLTPQICIVHCLKNRSGIIMIMLMMLRMQYTDDEGVDGDDDDDGGSENERTWVKFG